jgi:hypothetical protein
MVELSPQELKLALTPNEFFIGYLQNKLAAYAHQLIELKMDINPDPGRQMQVLMEIQRLQNFVAAYDELLAEIQDFTTLDTPTNSPN